jgi:lipoprotein-anchoring transpeptidase ErfK/SrfK
MKRTAVLSLVVLAAAAPAAASAQAPAAQPARAGGKIRLTLGGSHAYLGRRVALAGDTVRIRGVVSTYVAGETVEVRVTRGSRTVRAAVRTVRRLGRRRGAFTVAFRPTGDGSFRVRVIHLASARQAFLSARARVDVIVPHAGYPAAGLRVRFLQQRLAALGYAVPRNGVYKGGTQRAVLAFRKVNRMRRITSADPAVFARLARMKGGFKPRFPSHGRHIEADLSRQVLVLIDRGGRVFRTYHMSSGASGTRTIRGSFRVYQKSYGTNAKGMVHSSYFRGGYAIHGYHSVPVHPASHGCLRVPVPNALFIYRWVDFGTTVDTYR